MFKWLLKNYFIRILFLVVILIIVFIGVKDYEVHSRMCVQCESNMSEKLAYVDIELKKIKVTFHKNDGSGLTVSQIFTIGAGKNKFGYKEDGTPKWVRTGQFGSWDRDGYRLLGWSLSPTGTRAKYSIYSGVKDEWIRSYGPSVDLYAVWEKVALDEVKVTFHKNDGSGLTVSQIFTIGAGKNKFGYKEDGTPKWVRTGQFGSWDRDGYRLLGWSLSPTGTRAKYSIYSGVKDEWIRSYGPSVDLYAVWGEYVDLALLFGQSNMVGYAGNVNYEQNHKNIPLGIDDDIINNYHSYAYTEVSMKNNVAFEYRLLTNELVDISTNPRTFGENLTYFNGELKPYQSGDLRTLQGSKGTNMIPYLAKTYYENTGHKLVVVHASLGGKAIASFLPVTDKNCRKNSNGEYSYVYEAMIKKYKSAEKYLNSHNYIVNNKFYVVYQGENDSASSVDSVWTNYYNNFIKVHKYLKQDLDLSFGAIVYTAREGKNAPNIYGNMESIHKAQSFLIRKNDDILCGTDFVYKQYISGNNTIFAPNNNSIHLHSAGLSQVGRNVAKSIANSGKLK